MLFVKFNEERMDGLFLTSCLNVVTDGNVVQDNNDGVKRTALGGR